jgi:hypothetical protein
MAFASFGSPKWQMGKQVNDSFFLWDGLGSRDVFVVPQNGNLALMPDSGSVGIGTYNACASGQSTTPANCKLSVAGAIQAKEVVVNTGWSDYVFEPGYRLASLGEVADYIRANHHLPEIPSAKEVEEKGVSLGEMQSKLLAKIEELTLHMIQAEERSDGLERENRDLRERMGRIEAGAPVRAQ